MPGASVSAWTRFSRSLHSTCADIADLQTGTLTAFWIRPDGVFKQDIRIPAEWLNYAYDERELRMSGSLADVT